MAQRVESAFAYPGQLQIRQRKSSVSDDLSWGTRDHIIIAWVQNVPPVKLEWIE